MSLEHIFHLGCTSLQNGFQVIYFALQDLSILLAVESEDFVEQGHTDLLEVFRVVLED